MKRQGAARHLATPRTLLFLERDGRWLLIEGAAHKWWAGRLNGIGGSVEAGEDVLTGALREAEEETGLRPLTLDLAAVVHVLGDPAVLLFVYLGTLPPGELAPCAEGTFHWLSPEELLGPDFPLMPDLPLLLPRLWERAPGSAPLSLSYDFSEGLVIREGQL